MTLTYDEHWYREREDPPAVDRIEKTAAFIASRQRTAAR